MKVTKETNIAELITEHPITTEIFLYYGLHCVGCMAASFDSIEQGAKVHGLEEETIKEMVEKINQAIEEEQNSEGKPNGKD